MFRLELWIAVVLLAAILPSHAADLSKLDRSIGKEPRYQGKPYYCLLVFGPESKTRAWLVKDGDILFVSGKADGDWIKATKLRDTPHTYQVFVSGRDGKTTHDVKVDLAQGHFAYQHFNAPEMAQRQSTEGVIRFGDEPKSAPVVHFDGSYSSTLRERGVIQNGQRFRVPVDPMSPASGLHVYIGSKVLQSEGSAFVRTWWNHGIPEKLRPVADIEFPNQDPKAEPITLRVSLVFR